MRRPLIPDDHEADQESEVVGPIFTHRVQELAIGQVSARDWKSEREQRDRDGDHRIGEGDDRSVARNSASTSGSPVLARWRACDSSGRAVTAATPFMGVPN